MTKLKRIIQQNQRKRMFSDVTTKIQNQGGLKVNPETGVRYEEPLEEKHPAMDIALAVAQPGTIVEKALAPMVYKGMINGLSNGEGAEAVMIPTKFKSKELKQIFSNVQKYHPEYSKQTYELLNDIGELESLSKWERSRIQYLLKNLQNPGTYINPNYFKGIKNRIRNNIIGKEKALEEVRLNSKYIIKNAPIEQQNSIIPHNPKIQSIIDSDFTPFDEMKTMGQIGAKARTTANFRLSDYRKWGGRLKWK